MKRKHELFEVKQLLHNYIITNAPKKLFPQERDWTCSIACIRTLLSSIMENVPSEDDIISQYQIQAGPQYSKDLKALGILNDYDTIYACDQEEYTFDMVLELLEAGYFVMLESMLNYAHWTVLLGYYPLSDEDIEQSKFLLFDPYYNEVKLVNADEFISMWRDGNYQNTKVDQDFVALKAN